MGLILIILSVLFLSYLEIKQIWECIGCGVISKIAPCTPTGMEYRLKMGLINTTATHISIKLSLPEPKIKCPQMKTIIKHSVYVPNYRFTKDHYGYHSYIIVPPNRGPYFMLHGFRYFQRVSVELTQQCDSGNSFTFRGSIETGPGGEYCVFVIIHIYNEIMYTLWKIHFARRNA